METFVGGLAQGYLYGKDLKEASNKRKLRDTLVGINKTELTPEIGPDGKPAGFRFGDKVFREKPTEDLLSAERYKRIADATLAYGDPDKAMAHEEAARARRKSALDDIIQRAVMVDTPEAMVGAYSLMDDGVVPMFRRGPDGRPQAYTIENGQEKILLEGANDREFVDNALKFLSPDLSLKMAEIEWKRQKEMADYNKTLADTGYTRAQTGAVGLDSVRKTRGLQGLPASFDDYHAQRQQGLSTALKNVEIAKEAAQNAPTPENIQILQSELAKYQQLTGGGVGTGGRVATSGRLAGAYNALAPAIQESASRYGIPADALAGILAQESSLGQKMIGDNDNSWGIGHFNRKGAAADFKLTREQILSMPVEQQIDLAAKFLRQKIDQEKGDVWAGVRRYNGGGDPNYVQNVQQRIKELGLRSQPGLPDTAKGLATKPADSWMTKVDSSDVAAKAEENYMKLMAQFGFDTDTIDPNSAAELWARSVQMAREYHQSVYSGQNPQGVSDNPQADFKLAIDETIRRLKEGAAQ